MSATTTEQLLRDVHPADVTNARGDVLARAARIFVTSERLVIFQAVDEATKCTHSIPLDPESLPRASRSTMMGSLDLVDLDNGEVIWINRARGCGCGSPLKIMDRPFAW